MMNFLLVTVFLLVGKHLAHPPLENPALFEGDLVLTPDQQKAIEARAVGGAGGNAFAGVISNRWPATIPWTASEQILKSTKAMKAINSAIAEYEAKTCIRFIKRTTEKAYFYFFQGNGCYSRVGYHGTANKISLGSECQNHGTVLHEMFHSLGFFHEQCRYDRDNYVKIIWKNVPQRAKKDFQKYVRSQLDDRGVSYDYYSISHYRKDQWASGHITIETLDPKYQDIIGTRKYLSEKDVKQLKLMYRCNGQGGTLPPTLTPPPTRPQVCEDENGLSYCKPLLGYCKGSSASLAKILKKQCYKSCGYCN